METQTLYYVLAGALVLVGLAGVVLPALPGLPLMFAGMWLAAWAGGYEQVGVGTVIMLAVLTLLSLGVDIVAALLGAKRVGASRLALVGAAVGTVAGLFMGLVGILVGPFVGALLGEWLHGRRLGMAAKVGVGTWLGIVFAAVLKLTLGFAMLGIFVFAWWW
ncbi:MAG TPA: DUF456 domain-containing protein [Xanthomonadaceae bacterium]|nr:DUF456 domain-containing protein [Xanthomonadaceae bacterium]